MTRPANLSMRIFEGPLLRRLLVAEAERILLDVEVLSARMPPTSLG